MKKGNKNASKLGYAKLMQVRFPSENDYSWVVKNTTPELRGKLLSLLVKVGSGELDKDSASNLFRGILEELSL